MTAIVFDLGNSRAKWAWVEDSGALKIGAALQFGETGGWRQSLHQALLAMPEPEQVLLASVTRPDRLQAVCAVVKNLWSTPLRCLGSTARLAGVRNAYPVPGDLGVDRLLAMVAAHHRYPGPACIIDCGTALTLDGLAADGRHLGGLITASPALTRHALHRAAPALDGQAAKAAGYFANDTAQAVVSGANLAAESLIVRFVQATEREIGAAPRVLLSGGGMAELRLLLDAEYEWAPNLVLEGLAVVLEKS